MMVLRQYALLEVGCHIWAPTLGYAAQRTGVLMMVLRQYALLEVGCHVRMVSI